MRYYLVEAKCGHVGKGYYIPIVFPIKAGSATEAAAAARKKPRVKHHHRDAILSVKEVAFCDYEEQAYVNSFDPYLLCRSRKEQMQVFDAIGHRIIEDGEKGPTDAEQPKKAFYDGKKVIRNIRQFAREQAFEYALSEAFSHGREVFSCGT